jgi:cobalt-zinc-cadmium efflux system membrane fusion protein
MIAGIFIIIISCDTKNPEVKDQNIQTELPPSLKEKNKGIFLVRLSDKQTTELSIQTNSVKRNFVDYSIVAPGVVFPAPGHTSIISTPINGQVIRINVHEGDWVNKGQELFRIQSLEFGTLISEYLQAQAEEIFQTNRMTRLKQLVEESISSATELDRATSEYQRAMASVKSAYAKLKAVGVPDKEIVKFRDAQTFDPTLKVYTPISGVIEKNFVELGQSVNSLENLSRVLNTQKVLIRGYVSPKDARLMLIGDSVTISKREQPESLINATVTSMNPGLDEINRSVVANIIIPTKNGWPKPGENLRLSITSKTQKEIVAIPLEALTYDGNQAIVFVKKESDVFEKRVILVDEIKERFVFVESGLAINEEIAVTKVFSLKALSRFDIISEE